MEDLIIPDSVYPYLRVQQEHINHIEDRKEFEKAYKDGLLKQFELMLPWIPKNMHASLDIGSGMGGIDILLNNNFHQSTCLVDALNTLPICKKHNVPFNDYNICSEFFKKNGIDEFLYYLSPKEFKRISPFTHVDLIISIKSYCFHYSPEVYLRQLYWWCHKETVLIFDVRNDRPAWLKILRENFTEIDVLLEKPKYTKRVFKWKK